MGIDCSTLENWVRQASGTVRRELRNDQQRIRQPERENAHLKEVDNIIKKAHMYFMGKPRQLGTRARASGLTWRAYAVCAARCTLTKAVTTLGDADQRGLACSTTVSANALSSTALELKNLV